MIYHDSKCRGGPSPKKKSQPESEDGKVVITADNPVSCLYEYAKKVAKKLLSKNGDGGSTVQDDYQVNIISGQNSRPRVQLHSREFVGDLAEGEPDLQEDRIYHSSRCQSRL